MVLPKREENKMATEAKYLKVLSDPKSSVADRCKCVLALELNSREISKKTGINETQVRHMALVARKLSADAMARFENGNFDLGHARVIATFPVDEQAEFADRLTAGKWSVKKAKEKAAEGHSIKNAEEQGVAPTHFLALEEKLAEILGHRITIKPSGTKGEGGMVCIHYSNNEMFDSIFERLGIDLAEIV